MKEPLARDIWIALLVVGLTMANGALLAPLAPLIVERASGLSGTAAALVTAAFSIGNVLLQLQVPRLLQRYAPREVLVGTLGLLGLSTLVYVVASDSVAAMLFAALLRGASFGAAIVASSVVVTSLAPRERSGEVVGYFGLAVGLASLLTPPAGLYLAEIAGLEWPFALGGVAALVGSALGLAVSRHTAATKQSAIQLAQAIRDPRFAIPSLAFAAVSIAYGGLITFGPLALPSTGWGSAASFLLAYGILRALAAWLAGRQVDRLGARPVFYLGLIAGLVGLTALAAWQRTPFIEMAGGLYGICFGCVQTATYASMLGRVARSDYGMVSALWNSAFHLGSAAGALALGIVASSQGLGAVFWVLPVGLVLALFLPTPRREGRHP